MALVVVAVWGVDDGDRERSAALSAATQAFQAGTQSVSGSLGAAHHAKEKSALISRPSELGEAMTPGDRFEAICKGRPMEQDQVEAFIARVEEADELFGLDEVISAYEALIPNLKQVLGDTHHLTLSAHQALADYLSLDSRDAEATALLEAFIVDLPDDYQGRRVTAEVLGSLERFDDQVATLEALIADQSEALGTDHPDVRNCHHRLSDALCAAGRPEDAITTLEVLIADQSDALGSDHVDLFDSRYQLSEALCAADRFDEAIATLESLITDEQRVRGADDPDVLAARSVLSFMLRDAGQLDNAIATREALIADEERVFGSESSELLATRSALGRLLGEAGRTDEAVGILKEVLTDQRRVFGPEDPLTESTAEALADLQRSVRMQAKAKGRRKLAALLKFNQPRARMFFATLPAANSPSEGLLSVTASTSSHIKVASSFLSAVQWLASSQRMLKPEESSATNPMRLETTSFSKRLSKRDSIGSFPLKS